MHSDVLNLTYKNLTNEDIFVNAYHLGVDNIQPKIKINHTNMIFRTVVF
jgi:hypothetical protein